MRIYRKIPDSLAKVPEVIIAWMPILKGLLYPNLSLPSFLPIARIKLYVLKRSVSSEPRSSAPSNTTNVNALLCPFSTKLPLPSTAPPSRQIVIVT